MPRYLLSVIQPDGEPPSPEILEPIMRDVAAYDAYEARSESDAARPVDVRRRKPGPLRP